MDQVTGAQIAAAAEKYAGAGYVYGGNASSVGGWDCSSFVSYVLGHDLGMALPGGRWGQPGFPPNAHVPVVTSYAAWSGAVPTTDPQPGDLVLWVGEGTGGHIGFVTGPDKMCSALDSAQGRVDTPIVGYGPTGITQVYRHLTEAAGSAAPPGGGGKGVSSRSLVEAVAVAVLVTTALVGIVVGAAGLAGLGFEAATLWAVK